jgi:formate dehydrogenase
MPLEMTTPGKGQLRAFFVSAGNPVLSVPDGNALEEALEGLDLMVSLDLYVNETNRHADYVLPATTWLEREDVPVALMGFFTTPFIQVTEAVVEPAGEARQEWQVIDELSRRIGTAPYSLRVLRLLARLGIRITPRRLIDFVLRAGPFGDRFGLRRSGLSIGKVARSPHGVVLDEHIATGVLESRMRHGDKRVRLHDQAIAGEVERLGSSNGAHQDYPLRLIGMRELRSHNSWMHNSPLLMRGDRVQALRMNPADAATAGLADGDGARILSSAGSIEVPVKVSDEMMAGTVALPHGWGHRGGWQVANEARGANFNLLAPSDPHGLEPLAGMAFLSGIPVRVEAVPAATREPAPAATGEPAPA